jgi:hypothetical protein
MNQDYLQLPYNEVSFKAAHNSEERDESIIEQIEFHPEDPSNAGCRALELDMAQSNDGLQWSVSHSSTYDPSYPQLSQYLRQLREYGEQNPGHDPIAMYLDLKRVTTEQFPAQLDQYIRDYLGGDAGTPIYPPRLLMRDAQTLAEGARRYGWPTVGELRGLFIFCLTGSRDAKARYAVTDPADRLCFADKDEDPSADPSSDDRVFFNYHLYSSDFDKWCPVFMRAAPRRDAIIRAFVLNGETLWNNALTCGCHVLATDKIKGHSWAKVGDAPFVKLKPLPAE